MAAQRTRAALLVENIANSETTRTPEGGPYRRKDAIFSTEPMASAFASELDASLTGEPLTGVTVAGISVDSSAPEKHYMPGHPDADADGYVAMPQSESRGRHGGSHGRQPQLPGERRGHVGGQRHDPEIHRSAEVGGLR